jgi:hypothetical protein
MMAITMLVRLRRVIFDLSLGTYSLLASDHLLQVALTVMNRARRRVPCRAFGARLSTYQATELGSYGQPVMRASFSQVPRSGPGSRNAIGASLSSRLGTT